MPAARSAPTHSSACSTSSISARVVVRLRVAGARLLAPVEGDPELAGRLDDGVEQVVDRLVARRGDADRLPVREQVRDQASGRPGLARAGRALDHEVAIVQPEHELLHLVEVARSARAGRTARAGGSTRARGSGGRRRGASGRSRISAASCSGVLNAVFGTIASGSGTSSNERPRLSTSRRDSRSSSVIEPGDFPVARSAVCWPTPSLCSCGGKTERVGPGTVDAHRLAVLLEPADRLRVVEQLLGRHARSGRSRPTRPACARGRGSRAAAPPAPPPPRAAPPRSSARSSFASGIGLGSGGGGAGANGPSQRLAARAASRAAGASRCSPRGCTRRSGRAARARAVCIHCSKITIEVPPSFTSACRSKSRNASISFSP